MFDCILPVEELLIQLEPKIKRELFQTTPQNREDLEQHIKLKIVEKTEKINSITAPTLEEFLESCIKPKHVESN
ncbi:hypothetical protein AN964_23210 [Heyndrickxia shackletonii]|uniref:Uncharacterized protein n=1 Tax=Heyndrickxia shackletonii TaxID=157838 RepID=A0A0Q3WRR9_9BACI|nr:hypothetical protein [Heyndrickxia shackletonii]KQL50563.1 hypothetical protein AN964_23210 [Heyndrickxia shackletonii]NEY98126.1 hypothetical protein [Heyndrickxia shackletonii]